MRTFVYVSQKNITVCRNEMNKMTICCRKIPLKRLKTLINENILKNYSLSAPYTTIAVDNLDSFTNNLVNKYKKCDAFNRGAIGELKIDNHVNKFEKFGNMRKEELNNLILEMMTKNKDAQLEELITHCKHIGKLLDEETILKLFQRYSAMGRPDIIILLKKYCEQLLKKFHDSNNEFLHYIAKAECLRGNSEKGLSMLAIAYSKNKESRCYYRILFKELIQDSVLNRSEASLVIFRKYVQKFSEVWNDHYPLVCLWYLCWSSTWYSDQMLSNDLLESSEALLNIVRDKAVTFSIHVLKMDYKDDAVVRLLQILLKYDMMCEYSKVLQVLFNHKLRNGDLQGCAEIVRNAEILGIKLPSSQQGRYINLLIGGGTKTASKTKIGPKDFKLKF